MSFEIYYEDLNPDIQQLLLGLIGGNLHNVEVVDAVGGGLGGEHADAQRERKCKNENEETSQGYPQSFEDLF